MPCSIPNDLSARVFCWPGTERSNSVKRADTLPINSFSARPHPCLHRPALYDLVLLRLNFGYRLIGRHPERRRTSADGGISRSLDSWVGDPSLRLKSGYGRDDSNKEPRVFLPFIGD